MANYVAFTKIVKQILNHAPDIFRMVFLCLNHAICVV